MSQLILIVERFTCLQTCVHSWKFLFVFFFLRHFKNGDPSLSSITRTSSPEPDRYRSNDNIQVCAKINYHYNSYVILHQIMRKLTESTAFFLHKYIHVYTPIFKNVEIWKYIQNICTFCFSFKKVLTE